MMKRERKRSQASQAQHYIYIQRVVRRDDGEGGQSKEWVDVQRVSAAVLPIRAHQRLEYKTINVDATHLIKIRGRLSLNEKNRFRFNDRIFEILTIEDLQERGFVKVCTCLEKR